MKKKSMQIKIVGTCKTRTKKSSPDMFNCYVALAGHDEVTDSEKATTRRCNFKAQSL